MSVSDETGSLRNMISIFRVAELQTLLVFAGRNKNGKKNELQARALELASSGNEQQKAKIRELWRLASSTGSHQSPGSRAAPAGGQSAMASAIQQAIGRPFQPRLPTVPHPVDVRLKRLPFYSQQAELVHPMKLGSQGSGRFQEATYQFQLSVQQATDIALNRDTSPGSKLEYPYQVQLRFCPNDLSTDQADEFPPSICVQVNGKMLPLPNPVPGKANTEPKRPPGPVDLSRLCKLTPSLPNSVQVKWASDAGRGWVLAVGLVEKLSSDQLLERLVQRGTRDSHFTKDLIRAKLSDDDDGIATTNLKVTVACPLGKMRMTAPCRPSSCDHLQCFDAHLFIQMNERKPTWQCPVCDGAALFDTLVVDGYFLDVISSAELAEDENEIILATDGSWRPVPRSEDAERIAREREAGDGVSEQEEDDSTSGRPATPLVREVDCIDLDSD